MKRVLQLAMLLDRAQQGRTAAPLLFRKEQEPIKSTAALLAAFLQGSLQGHGDTTRQLSLLGYRLTYTQTPLMELDLRASNLAVDLRDGTRLCRAAEARTQAPLRNGCLVPVGGCMTPSIGSFLQVLTGTDGLLAACKVPAPASHRSLREHNVSMALAALQKSGMSLEGIGLSAARVGALDIVDGLPDKTLGLLWRMFNHFQLRRLVDAEVLAAEVARLSNRARHRSAWITGFEAPTAAAPSAPHSRRSSVDLDRAERSGGGASGLRPSTSAAVGRKRSFQVYEDESSEDRPAPARASFVELDLGPGQCEPLAELLLRWAQACCAAQGVRLGRDLSRSFADGSALCLLVSLYQPQHLARAQVSVPGYRRGPEALVPEWDDLHDSGAFWMGLGHTGLARGARANYQLLQAAVKRLGALPMLVADADFGGDLGPDPRAVLGFLAFLAPRLLSATREDRAALKLQRWWRLHQLRQGPAAAAAKREQWGRAAERIQRAWRARMLRRRLAQHAAFRSRLAAAATRLQAMFRRRRARKQYLVSA